MEQVLLNLPVATYVVAVSGGVDSMALLDMLVNGAAGSRLIVAHFDHGIREDSLMDRELVRQVARDHGLVFVYDEGKLGAGTSEEAARAARYAFLRKVQRAAKARAIITAHHQDDLLETAVINLVRGTNRRGLTALSTSNDMVRPLLSVPKQALLQYAKERSLAWREDSTNGDLRYLRNSIRHVALRKLTGEQRAMLAVHLHNLARINHELDAQLANYLHLQAHPDRLGRHIFIGLTHAVAREVMAAWLRAHEIHGYDRKLLERLIVAAKTLPPGKAADIRDGYVLQIEKHYLALTHSDR